MDGYPCLPLKRYRRVSRGQLEFPRKSPKAFRCHICTVTERTDREPAGAEPLIERGVQTGLHKRPRSRARRRRREYLLRNEPRTERSDTRALPGTGDGRHARNSERYRLRVKQRLAAVEHVKSTVSSRPVGDSGSVYPSPRHPRAVGPSFWGRFGGSRRIFIGSVDLTASISLAILENRRPRKALSSSTPAASTIPRSRGSFGLPPLTSSGIGCGLRRA
jgi:hypothetical protein